MFAARFYGIDTLENNLDQGSILEDLCLQVEIIDFDYPLSTPEGSDSSISIRAAHFIGDDGPFFDPPLMIRGSYTFDSIPQSQIIQPLSLDSDGRYTKSIRMLDETSTLFGSIKVYYPELEFVSNNTNFEISNDNPTTPVANWNLNGNFALDGLWYPTETYFDANLMGELYDKGPEFQNPNLAIYSSKKPISPWCDDIEAGVNFFFDGTMKVKHSNVHNPASISFFTNTPNIGWYTDESNCSSSGSYEGGSSGSSSLTCRANSAQIDGANVQLTGYVNENFEIYSLIPSFGGPFVEFMKQSHVSATEVDPFFGQTFGTICDENRRYTHEVSVRDLPSCEFGKQQLNEAKKELSDCEYFNCFEEGHLQNKLDELREISCRACEKPDTEFVIRSGIPCGSDYKDLYTTYRTETEFSNSKYPQNIAFDPFREFLISSPIPLPYLPNIPLQQGTYNKDVATGVTEGGPSTLEVTRGTSSITLTPIKDEGNFKYRYGPNIINPDIPNYVLETLKEIAIGAGANSVIILDNFYHETQDHRHAYDVAISPFTFAQHQSFEAEVNKAISEGKVVSFVKPGQDTWYMKEWKADGLIFNNYGYWLQIPERQQTTQAEQIQSSPQQPNQVPSPPPIPQPEPETEPTLQPTPQTESTLQSTPQTEATSEPESTPQPEVVSVPESITTAEKNIKEQFTMPKYKETKQVSISGEIKNYKRGILVEISIINPDGTTESIGIIPKKSGEYYTQFSINDKSLTGTYDIEIKYDGEIQESFSIEIVSSQIPTWIKNNAKWWSDNQIDDDTFISGMQYLIKEDIIKISGQPQTSITSNEIPDWVKNNAGWWADGLKTEDDFVAGIKWLVENGVIRV